MSVRRHIPDPVVRRGVVVYDRNNGYVGGEPKLTLCGRHWRQRYVGDDKRWCLVCLRAVYGAHPSFRSWIESVIGAPLP